jgi:sterol desaturase/sphingolipid hydroxylase (fatty acid hydroxylase superfamily)
MSNFIYLHRFASYMLHTPLLLAIVAFGARAIVITTVEKLRPAHKVEYRKVVAGDLVAAVVCALFVIPGSDFVNRWIVFRPAIPQFVNALPLVLRFLTYIVIADFGHYWVHRAMHSPALWRVHKWHHYPTYMYWLAGVRGSLIQQVLVNIPYIAAATLVYISPWWMVFVILGKNALQNDWMHLNVPWGSKWLEWIIVTPRYHHVHHSDDPVHYRANLAALFPIWDHIFGTYVDPDGVRQPLSFGIGERVPALRLVVGI